MLSQRTVGKFQYLLEQMYQPLTSRSGAGLTPSTYHRLLYEAGVLPELLDYIGKEYSHNPRIFVRALHEGQPLAALRGGKLRSQNPTQADADAGDRHLLQFAAVALQRWAELCSENYFCMGRAYDDAAVEFVDSLRREGLRWDRSGECILAENGTNITPPPIGEVHSNACPSIQKPLPPVVHIEKEAEDRPDSVRRPLLAIVKISAFFLITVLIVVAAYWRLDFLGWGRSDKLTCIGVLLGFAAVVANWLVVPEVRRFLRLDSGN